MLVTPSSPALLAAPPPFRRRAPAGRRTDARALLAQLARDLDAGVALTTPLTASTPMAARAAWWQPALLPQRS